MEGVCYVSRPNQPPDSERDRQKKFGVSVTKLFRFYIPITPIDGRWKHQKEAKEGSEILEWGTCSYFIVLL
jgi:hypothetical protein